MDIVNNEKIKPYFEASAYESYNTLIKNDFIDTFLFSIENFFEE